MPVWLLLVCMTLANYRATRLATRDDLPPILWLRDRLAGGWRPLTPGEQEQLAGDPDLLGTPWATDVRSIDGAANRYVRRARWSPHWLAELVSCPWCVSGWLAAALTAAVAGTIGLPAPALAWGAVWGASALLASREWA